MTQRELSTLLRDHVSRDEPPFTGPEPLIARGRRTVRTRRAVVVAGIAIVATVGAVTGVRLTDSPGGEESRRIDPATERALDDYHARAMPDLLDREARAVFSPSLPDLGEGEFSAVDGNQEEIPPEHYDKASGMSISYVEPGARELGVSLSHGRSEAEGDAQKYCAEGLEGGYYLECAVDVRPDGSLAISKLWALRPLKYGNLAQDTWHAVTSEQLTRIDRAKLWFERSVKVVKSETFVTYVNETVKAPSRAAAERLFAVPVADLVELGTDPLLVIPHPPPDPGSGCDAWMLPDSNVTCGRSAP